MRHICKYCNYVEVLDCVKFMDMTKRPNMFSCIFDDKFMIFFVSSSLKSMLWELIRIFPMK